MIHIEIIKSKNNDQIGDYQFQKNLIYIGSNISSDLYFDDPSIMANHLFIEIVDHKLIIHPNKKLNFFLLDGKRTTSMRFLKINQIVNINDCEFKIKNFRYSHYQSLRDLLNSKTDELITQKSPKIELISKIEEFNKNDNT